MKLNLMIAAVWGAISLPISSQAADWPQYRGPSHDGKTSEKIADMPAGGPRRIWQSATQNGFSSFAVKGPHAVTQVLREVDGVRREVLVAFNSETGKETWSLPVGMPRYGHDGGNAGADNNSGGDGPRSTPTIDGDRVYNLSSDLLLTSHELATGKAIWTKDIIKEHKGEAIKWKNAASPLILGEMIFVGGGGNGEALLGINKNTGKVVWKGENDQITHATPVPATIHGVEQVIFFTQKGLVAVRPETGKVLWRQAFRFSVSTAASPVVEGDIVFCSAGYGVGAGAYRISRNGDTFSSEELWRTTGDKLANHWSTPVVKDGHLYGMFQFKEYGTGPLKCVELATGKEKWSKPGFGPGNVILAGEKLVVLGDAGQVAIVDPQPGAYKELGRFQAVSGKCWSTPALADGRLYVRSTKEGAAFDVSSKLTQR